MMQAVTVGLKELMCYCRLMINVFLSMYKLLKTHENMAAAPEQYTLRNIPTESESSLFYNALLK